MLKERHRDDQSFTPRAGGRQVRLEKQASHRNHGRQRKVLCCNDRGRLKKKKCWKYTLADPRPTKEASGTAETIHVAIEVDSSNLGRVTRVRVVLAGRQTVRSLVAGNISSQLRRGHWLATLYHPYKSNLLGKPVQDGGATPQRLAPIRIPYMSKSLPRPEHDDGKKCNIVIDQQVL